MDAKERQNWINVLRLVSQSELSELASSSGNIVIANVTKSSATAHENDAAVSPQSVAHLSSEPEAQSKTATTLQHHLSPQHQQPKLTNLDLIKEIYNHVKMSNQMLEDALIV